MPDERVIQRLLEQVHSGNPAQQSAAVDSIRDLSLEPDFRTAFGEAGAVAPLVGLLSGDADLTIKAAQALRHMAVEDSLRLQIVEAGGVLNFVGLLQEGQGHSQELQAAVLQAVLALAVDESSRLAFNRSNGLPVVVKIIETSEDEGLLDMACQLLGRMGHNKVIKNSMREHAGIVQMLKLLQKKGTAPGLLETIVQALTILVVENEINQDYVREQYGVEAVVKLLDPKLGASLASSATTCLTALCINNDDNKNHTREQWAIPLLVNLLEQEDSVLQEKAVDCLRVLTTANDLNKLSLFSIPAGVRSLVNIMTRHQAGEVITERAAAVIGNLSTTEQFYSAIRECGGLQRLVTLLDCGPTSSVTEIAAKTLANMAANDNNRMGIRLAGGRPPLVHLLTQRPSEQVLLATEEALRRLQVTNEERNAILETLRYCDQQQAARASLSSQAQQQEEDASGGRKDAETSTRPLTQYTVEQMCDLLQRQGIKNTGVFEENGVTGGDLLELSAEEMADNLCLTPLQAKKLQNVKKAFQTFEEISITPGKAELSQFELREWLARQGRSEEEIQAIVSGFKRALGREPLALLTFSEFALNYQWFVKTLQVMVLADDEALDFRRAPSFVSLGSVAPSPAAKGSLSLSEQTECNRPGALGTDAA